MEVIRPNLDGIAYKKRRKGSKCPPCELVLKLYNAYTAKELSEIIGVKESTIRSWVCRARKEYKAKYGLSEQKG